LTDLRARSWIPGADIPTTLEDGDDLDFCYELTRPRTACKLQVAKECEVFLRVHCQQRINALPCRQKRLSK